MAHPKPSANGADDTLWQATQVGAASGIVGYVVGATAGVLRSAHSPVLFGLASSLQWAGLGVTFWASRAAILSAWYADGGGASVTQRDAVSASVLAGAFSGGLLGMVTRGRRNALPGAIMFSLFGGLGQAGVNEWKTRAEARQARSSEADESTGSFLGWLARQKWTPISALSNEEYCRILDEKILRLDVEIALADDRLAALKGEMLERQGERRQRQEEREQQLRLQEIEAQSDVSLHTDQTEDQARNPRGK